ncbi:MAG: hypothetical protein Q4G43_12795 [Mobilicoccus sp.]|nr:hypothetical protein [Mobilicoccus sp.]
MPSRQRAIRQLVSLGVKYGPLAYQGLKHGKAPVQQFADRQVSKRNARGMAMEHAAHLLDGSVLPVYYGDLRVWVVFSGDVPVGTHPVVSTPMADLLEHYDLSKRLRPSEPSKRRRRTSTSSPSSTATGWPQDRPTGGPNPTDQSPDPQS